MSAESDHPNDGSPVLGDRLGKLDGLQFHTAHQFEAKFGAAAAKFTDGKIRQMKPFDENYQAYPYISHNEAVERGQAVFEELSEHEDDFIASRAGSVLSDGALRQQFKGIIPPTDYLRKSLGLIDPADDKQTVGGVTYDSLFYECQDVIVALIKQGLQMNDATSSEYIPRIAMKRGSNRGDPSYLGGQPGNEWMVNRLMDCTKSRDGLFDQAFVERHIALGVRTQSAGIEFVGANPVSKMRESFIQHPDKPLSNVDVYASKVTNPGGVPFAQRVRDVNAVSQIPNPPLMAVNAIIMDNLHPKLERIWKTNVIVESYHDMVLGKYVANHDYQKYDTTMTRDSRWRFAEALYSKEVFEIVKTIDKSPIIGAYSAATALDETRVVRYSIDRSVNSTLFSPLLSGTGDTSLQGKGGQGLPDMLRTLSLLCDASPWDLVDFDNPTNTSCIACEALVNVGDDGTTILDPICEYTGRSIEDVASQYVDLLAESSVFNKKLERPGKMAGQLTRVQLKRGEKLADLSDVDLLTRRVISVSHDPISMFTNHMWPEHAYSSAFRSPPAFGLSEAIKIYRSTIEPWYSDQGYGDFDELAELMLFGVGFDHSLDVLEDEGQFERLQLEQSLDSVNPDDDSAEAVAAQINLIVAKLGLKNQSELDWKYTKGELFNLLTPEEIARLYIIVPDSLVSRVEDFVNINSNN